MFCGKCGKELREKAAFCASCGNPVNQTREVSVSGARRGPINAPRRVKQTDYGLEKELSLWNVHKVKKPELYGGHSNRAYWLFGLLTIFLAWPVGLIVFLIDFKSKSVVRKCQARNLLITAGLGCIFMLGVIVQQGNEGKKINNTGLIAADGTMHERKEQDTRRTEDGFSFIGINWNDKPEIVMEKIRQSGYASGDHATWWMEDNGSFHAAHLVAILDDPLGTMDKTTFLANVGGRWTNQLQRSNDITVKQLSFTGKTDSIAKEGEFFFTYKTDILLSYTISINNKVAHFDLTGEGGFYQSLIEKYGKPGRRTQGSRIWSQKDQTLYYILSPGGERANLIYISEKNVSDYVETIEKKRNALEEASKKKQTDAVRKDF